METGPKPATHHLRAADSTACWARKCNPACRRALCSPVNTFRIEPQPPGRVSSGRRTAFANWVATPENPLFARVMVNRIWQHHFLGTGLVATVDNLGVSGASASHLELLDFLAAEFMSSAGGEGNPPADHVVRGVLSERYRDGLDAIDPDNRPSLGTRSGGSTPNPSATQCSTCPRIDRRAGGPHVASKRTAEGIVEIVENEDGGARRRSLYLQQRRTQVVTFCNSSMRHPS